MTTTRFRPWMCLRCGYAMDAASGAFDDKIVPEEGDLSLCLNCAAPYELRAGTWQPVGADVLGKLPVDQALKVRKAQAAIRLMVTKDLSKRGGRA